MCTYGVLSIYFVVLYLGNDFRVLVLVLCSNVRVPLLPITKVILYVMRGFDTCFDSFSLYHKPRRLYVCTAVHNPRKSNSGSFRGSTSPSRVIKNNRIWQKSLFFTTGASL